MRACVRASTSGARTHATSQASAEMNLNSISAFEMRYTVQRRRTVSLANKDSAISGQLASWPAGQSAIGINNVINVRSHDDQRIVFALCVFGARSSSMIYSPSVAAVAVKGRGFCRRALS